MQYMLDTNICIYLIKKRPAHVIERMKWLGPGDVGISAITVSELQYGAAKSDYPEKNREALGKFLTAFELVPFGSEATLDYGEIRAKLERDGKPIGAMDLLIAAHARSLGVVLVTNNVREFERVPGLCLENWAENTAQL